MRLDDAGGTLRWKSTSEHGAAPAGSAFYVALHSVAGSIAVGKRGDLVLVDGDPTRDIAAVRKTDIVVCRGAVYDAAALFAAVGMRPR
jgi:cytosine/adenosine deaminase-related metal-dependent hydrolase